MQRRIETLRQELRKDECRGRRVTVVWHCGASALPLCATGRVVAVGCDFVQLRGCVRTFDDGIGCASEHLEELDTLIRLHDVCAVIQGLPPGRKGGLNTCCGGPDPAPRL